MFIEIKIVGITAQNTAIIEHEKENIHFLLHRAKALDLYTFNPRFYPLNPSRCPFTTIFRNTGVCSFEKVMIRISPPEGGAHLQYDLVY